jgi:hypothetical protein
MSQVPCRVCEISCEDHGPGWYSLCQPCAEDLHEIINGVRIRYSGGGGFFAHNSTASNEAIKEREDGINQLRAKKGLPEVVFGTAQSVPTPAPIEYGAACKVCQAFNEYQPKSDNYICYSCR